MKYLSIDPSGTGTTGVFFCNGEAPRVDSENSLIKTNSKFSYLFLEYKSDNWEEHLAFIVNTVKECQPDIIIYETTNYIHKRMPSSLSLLKLIGGIVGLKHSYTFIQGVNSVAFNSVKSFRERFLNNQEKIWGLSYQVGRGKGWKYNSERISLHQLDALVVAELWWRKQNSPPKKKRGRKKKEMLN